MLVLQLYILLQRVSFFCAIFWICSFIVKELKRDIRGFFRKEKEKLQRRLVKDNGIDGYIVLMQLPSFLNSKEDAAVYFEENEVMTCRPSIYDCTGQAFTSWYKIVERSGSLWAYHSVCFDV